MSTVLETAKIHVKEARELAYLGKYVDALLRFKQQIAQIENQSQKIQNDAMLIQEWNRLLNELREESELITQLLNYTKGNLTIPQSPQKHRSLECPDFHEEPRQPKFPFNQVPFQHNKLPRDQSSPPRQQNQFQISPPKQNKAQDADDVFFGGLRNNNDKPQKRGEKYDRDPDVWDPPSKPTQKKKPVQKQAPKNQNNPFKPQQQQQQQDKRDYNKPWLQNAQIKEKQNKNQDGSKKSFHDYVYPDGRGPDSDLIQMLEREVVNTNPDVSFDKIAELDQAKEILQEAVLLPLLMPQLFTGIRRPVKGVLLFGPPGTGKTMLAKAVATTGKTTFFNVSASSLASKWKGESEKLVRLLFEMARYYSPATIFFDEIDALGSKRGDNDGDSTRKVKTELLIQMDGVQNTNTGEDRKLVMCLAATNRPWDLDEALIRRLERRIYIPLPSECGRRELFNINLNQMKLGQIDWDQLVKKCDGYSGADIALVCREASMLPMRRKLRAEGGIQKFQEKYGENQDIMDEPLEQKDFEEAIKNVNKSVTNEYLKEYDKWMKEFGTAGI